MRDLDFSDLFLAIATICGIIFGPKGANLFNPNSWGNVDQITLECARIVLVVQCFAVGVELPKVCFDLCFGGIEITETDIVQRYMTRHWKSIIMLLIPVMTFGWLICSLFIWWLIPTLSWLEALCCAACITATDPVLASSVVGKGKFAKRVPKHLRDLLSAESGCNDGMAFPFIYLALYIIKYKGHPGEIAQHWFCLTILYECLFGAIYGIVIGYAGRHAIKYAERHNLIDRESFLVFYFVLALFCAGTGSLLGLDDLLVGFCAGVAFSNDGWFSQQTEDSHVSNVIDLLLNLAFFVYFGAIIPWGSYNRPEWGITPWRLVVISILTLLFRRIPIMLALKPLIPDIKTWREALFAGHFGPIGVGAIFVAILARASLEHGEPTPLAVLPPPGSTNYLIIELIWPITTFLIIASILVHGSSIAVFTLGKRINTMRITMSYTTANEENNWMNRLPRLTPKASMRKSMDDQSDSEKAYPPGTLPPVGGIPGGFLRRIPDDSAPPDESQMRRRGLGGPISDSAIGRPVYRTRTDPLPVQSGQGTSSGDVSPTRVSTPVDREDTVGYQEGNDIIIENREGDVIGHQKSHERDGHHQLPRALDKLAHPHMQRDHDIPQEVSDEYAAMAAAKQETAGSRRRPAWAYRYDDDIIVEDDEGEVIRQYRLPKEKRPPGLERRSSIPWATSWTNKLIPGRSGKAADPVPEDDDNDDAKTIYSINRDEAGPSSEKKRHINWRMHDEHGRRLSKNEFLTQLQTMDPHARAVAASPSPITPTNTDLAARLRQESGATNDKALPTIPSGRPPMGPRGGSSGSGGDEREVETAAERRRREAAFGIRRDEEDSEDEGQAGRLDAKKQGSGTRGVMSKIGLGGITHGHGAGSSGASGSGGPGIRFAPGVRGAGTGGRQEETAEEVEKRK